MHQVPQVYCVYDVIVIIRISCRIDACIIQHLQIASDILPTLKGSSFPARIVKLYDVVIIGDFCTRKTRIFWIKKIVGVCQLGISLPRQESRSFLACCFHVWEPPVLENQCRMKPTSMPLQYQSRPGSQLLRRRLQSFVLCEEFAFFFKLEWFLQQHALASQSQENNRHLQCNATSGYQTSHNF